MYIYNVSIKVDLSIVEEWTLWMQETHIGEVMATGHFTDYKFCRLLDQDESEGITFVIQYYCDSIKDYLDYKNNHADRLQTETRKLFQDKYIGYRSVMREIQRPITDEKLN